MDELGSIRKKVFNFVLNIQSDLLQYSEIFNALADDSGCTPPAAQIKLNIINRVEYQEYAEEISGRIGKYGYYQDSFFIWIEDTLARIRVIGKDIILNIPDFKKWGKLPSSVSEAAILIFLRGKDYFPLHASGGSYKSNILFAGRSGCGKSTLVYLLDQIGGRVLSDDRVFLRLDSGKFTCRSLSNKIHLWDGDPSSGERKTEYHPKAADDSMIPVYFGPEKIFFPVFSDEAYPWICKIERTEAVMRLIPLTLPLRYTNDLFLIKEFASVCNCFRLNLPRHIHRPEATIRLLQENC